MFNVWHYSMSNTFQDFPDPAYKYSRRFNTLKQRVIQSLVNLYTRTGPKSLLSFNWVQPLKETSLLEGRIINSVINSPNRRRWLIKAYKTNLTPRIDIKAEIDSKKSKKGILTSSTFASVRHFEFRKAARAITRKLDPRHYSFCICVGR